MVKMLRTLLAVLVLTVTVSCGDGTPDAPKNLTAVAGASTVSLSWDSVDSGAETTKYNVYRGTTESGTLNSKTKVASSLSEVTYSDASVTTQTTYYYQVTAENSKGESGASNEVKATVGTLPAPANLTATAGTYQVQLSWDTVSGATGYNLYRGTTQTGAISGKSKIITDTSATSYTDTAVNHNTTYYYQVTATDGTRESTASEEVAATP
jgi:cellulose 1,4-beta-cellobiosidase